MSDQQPTPTERITSLTASREAETVQRAIYEKYNFTPPLRFCLELIAFVEEICDGQQQQPRRIG